MRMYTPERAVLLEKVTFPQNKKSQFGKSFIASKKTCLLKGKALLRTFFSWIFIWLIVNDIRKGRRRRRRRQERTDIFKALWWKGNIEIFRAHVLDWWRGLNTDHTDAHIVRMGFLTLDCVDLIKPLQKYEPNENRRHREGAFFVMLALTRALHSRKHIALYSASYERRHNETIKELHSFNFQLYVSLQTVECLLYWQVLWILIWQQARNVEKSFHEHLEWLTSAYSPASYRNSRTYINWNEAKLWKESWEGEMESTRPTHKVQLNLVQ